MNGHQVRTNNGGGTRRLNVLKDWRKEDIKIEAISLFFPGGKSSKGPIENYSVDLLDFKRHVFSDTLTIAEMFKITALTTLRFYLSTIENEDVTDIPIVTQNSSQISEDTLTVDESNENILLTNSSYETVYQEPQFDMHELIHYNDTNLTFAQTENIAFEEIIIPYETIKLTLHRGHIYSEMLTSFINTKSINLRLEVEIVLPNGEKEAAFDAGGVLKDALTEFWETFYESRCIGSSVKVPCLRHDYDEERWKAIGRILCVGYRQANIFPCKLARPFVEHALFGFITSDMLESFMKFIGPSDAIIIKNALHNFDDVDFDEILDIMQNLDCKLQVNKENFKGIITDIAHKEFIQKPMFIIDSFSTVVRMKFTDDEINDIYELKKLTNKNVLKLLPPTNSYVEPQQEKVMRYLNNFIREADNDILENFLRYCTGATNICTNRIDICFNASTGIKRAPVGHTCTNTLELSTTYDNYTDFKSEFKNILKSGIWIMDIL